MQLQVAESDFNCMRRTQELIDYKNFFNGQWCKMSFSELYIWGTIISLSRNTPTGRGKSAYATDLPLVRLHKERVMILLVGAFHAGSGRSCWLTIKMNKIFLGDKHFGPFRIIYMGDIFLGATHEKTCCRLSACRRVHAIMHQRIAMKNFGHRMY